VNDEDQQQKNGKQDDGALPQGSGEASSQANREGVFTDGRIPPHLREWILARFPADELERSLEELNEEDLLELHEFLDLDELEREAASEQANRQR
jgi:hypothetical protein